MPGKGSIDMALPGKEQPWDGMIFPIGFFKKKEGFCAHGRLQTVAIILRKLPASRRHGPQTMQTEPCLSKRFHERSAMRMAHQSLQLLRINRSIQQRFRASGCQELGIRWALPKGVGQT